MLPKKESAKYGGQLWILGNHIFLKVCIYFCYHGGSLRLVYTKLHWFDHLIVSTSNTFPTKKWVVSQKIDQSLDSKAQQKCICDMCSLVLELRDISENSSNFPQFSVKRGRTLCFNHHQKHIQQKKWWAEKFGIESCKTLPTWQFQEKKVWEPEAL